MNAPQIHAAPMLHVSMNSKVIVANVPQVTMDDSANKVKNMNYAIIINNNMTEALNV